MRTLKFRAWDSENNRMIYKPEELHKITYNETDNGFHMGRNNKNGDWMSLEIMQFTGLRDKNGKEIFEGDIVKHQWNGCEEEGPFIVESLEWAYIENRNEKNGKLTCISEIIGNIYENPSLLKDTQA